MKWIKRILPHATIVLSMMTLTFFCIDRVNTGMAFMTSELSKWVFMLLAVCALFCAIFSIVAEWREQARIARRQARAAHRRAAMLDEEPETDDQDE